MAREVVLTVHGGITIQSEQLAQWKQLLKKEVYLALEIFARRDNHLAENGYDIVRGTQLDNFVSNFLYYKSQEGRLQKELGMDYAIWAYEYNNKK